MSADVAEACKHKREKQHLHAGVWSLVHIEVTAYFILYVSYCTAARFGVQQSTYVSSWSIVFFSVKATAFYNCNTRVKLDSCIFFTNAPRAEELLGKSCAQHKEALIAFYSAIQFFHSSPQALSGVSPSCLKSTLLLGIVCHLAICGHSASSFHCYINETNPCCVSDDVDMEKDDFTSLSGVGTNTRKLVKVGMFGP